MVQTKKVVFIAKDDCVDILKKLLTDMVKPSQEEEGCLLYHIYQKADKPNTFVVIETWESDEALQGHKNSQHYKYYKSNYEQYTADKYSEELIELGV